MKHCRSLPDQAGHSYWDKTILVAMIFSGGPAVVIHRIPLGVMALLQIYPITGGAGHQSTINIYTELQFDP